jgi:carotenoid cleavage dioxygenase-like enzyme
VTEKYIVIGIGSARTDGMKMLRERQFLSGIWFDKSRDTTFFVVDRKSKTLVATYSAPPCFFFHISNVFEDSEGSLLIDICRYADISVFETLKLKDLTAREGMVKASPSILTRYTLANVTTRTRGVRRAKEELICPQQIDLPSINPRNAGKKYRYVYGLSVNCAQELFSAVTKIDVESGSTFCCTTRVSESRATTFLQ